MIIDIFLIKIKFSVKSNINNSISYLWSLRLQMNSKGELIQESFHFNVNVRKIIYIK